MAKKIEIEITGDTKSLEKALSKAQKSSSSFEKGLSTAAKGATVALAGIGVGAAFAVKSASDLGEQIAKASVVFRGSEKDILAWSETTASSFGISRRAALEAAGTFGNMLVPMGLARDKAADMSQKMVELAADMASFNNASPEETLDAIRAGLAGETEPLRRFGVFLNEARIKQEALSMGLIKGKEEMTAADKATASYSLILKDTADTQGDFARTSDSLANQQRIIKAQFEDTAAALGTALLPAATDAAGALLSLVGVMKEHDAITKALVASVAAFAAGIILLRASVAIYTSTTLAAIGATAGLRLALATTPWGLAAVAAAGLVAWLISQKDKASDAEGAQRGLTDALLEYNDAVKAGKNARIDLESANLRLERAEINVKQAVNDRKVVEKDSTSTLLDRREADLRVAEALNERRRAEMNVKDATKEGTDAQWKQNTASEKLAGTFGELTAKYQGNLTELQKVFVKGKGVGRVLERLSDNTAEARDNAARYADALRNMADSARVNNPKLARTADLAANLADAWGRVVSLPAAREFVARFSVITRVETNRVIPGGPRQAGGPVMAGRAYIVGERRPEVFVPNESGKIIPRVSQVTGGTSNGGGNGGPMQLALVAVGPDILRQLRELDRRARLGGAPA